MAQLSAFNEGHQTEVFQKIPFRRIHVCKVIIRRRHDSSESKKKEILCVPDFRITAKSFEVNITIIGFFYKLLVFNLSVKVKSGDAVARNLILNRAIAIL